MLRASHLLQLTVVALLGLAVVMVHSAGMQIGGPRFELWNLLTSRHTLYAALAVAAMFLASRLDVRQFMRLRGWQNPLLWVLLLSLAAVVAAMIPGVGTPKNGAWRWLTLGRGGLAITFQPSELVKWVMVLVLAQWCARRRGVMHRLAYGLLPIGMVVALACGLIILEDLGTAVLIAMVAACVLLAGGARWWQLGMVLPPAAAALLLAIIYSPYRLARLTAFLNPWDDPRGIGYHPIQAMLAFAGGGLTGRGLGNGVQKFGYLPEDTTDFVFAVIGEELGLAGAALVVALFLVVLWVGLGIIRNCRDTFGSLLGLGVLLTIGAQAVLNLAVVTVVVPTKGIALPLLSAGGTGWIMTAFSLGLVAALDNAHWQESQDSQVAISTVPPTLRLGLERL